MTDNAPGWLNVMRSLNGTKEIAGPEANPVITGMADEIARRYPDMKWYCDLPSWDSDETAWCGLSGAYCCAVSGVRPPFAQKPAPDTDRWGWAKCWSTDQQFGTVLSEPRLGCIVVMERSGGGHITFYESTSGSNYMCRGGNQSNSVNLSAYPKSSVIALVWPTAAGPIPPAERRQVSRGDTGADVAQIQTTLGLPADGDFGAITEAGVKAFQGACALAKDGIVGPNTWGALDQLDARMLAGDDGVGDELEQEIEQLVQRSPILQYNWPGRGKMPVGYYLGMAKTFALACRRLDVEDQAALIMAQASSGNPDTDALTWYAQEFRKAEIEINENGINTLRALFVMMIGLGPRESSGNHWEGRDMSASNTSADTAEAGLFQTSWNIRSCSSAIPPLLPEYWDDPNGFRPSFSKGVTPTASQLDCYGSGDGARYQWLSRFCPAFHSLVTGVGMRKLRKHWGPIGRREVQLVGEVDDLLLEVQALVEAAPPEPEPEPEPKPEPPIAPAVVEIRTSGPVTIIVNGQTTPVA